MKPDLTNKQTAASGGDVTIDMMARKDREFAFEAVSGIGRELLRLPSRVLFYLLQGRGKLERMVPTGRRLLKAL